LFTRVLATLYKSTLFPYQSLVYQTYGAFASQIRQFTGIRQLPATDAPGQSPWAAQRDDKKDFTYV